MTGVQTCALPILGKMAWSPVQGQRLDTGEPAGYLEAILTYARTRPDLKAVLDRAGA